MYSNELLQQTRCSVSSVLPSTIVFTHFTFLPSVGDFGVTIDSSLSFSNRTCFPNLTRCNYMYFHLRLLCLFASRFLPMALPSSFSGLSVLGLTTDNSLLTGLPKVQLSSQTMTNASTRLIARLPFFSHIFSIIAIVNPPLRYCFNAANPLIGAKHCNEHVSNFTTKTYMYTGYLCNASLNWRFVQHHKWEFAGSSSIGA